MTMRLIDAEALKIKIQKIKAEALEHGFAPESVCGDILLNFLDNAPTIEAKPVVHAHWEEGKCSNCEAEACSHSWDEPIYDYDWDENLQYIYTEHHTEYDLTDFCPFCGAQMDEKESD